MVQQVSIQFLSIIDQIIYVYHFFSEEALAKCEGLIYNVPLNGETSCTPDITKSEMNQVAMEVSKVKIKISSKCTCLV